MTSRTDFNRRLQANWPLAFTAPLLAAATLGAEIARADIGVRVTLSAALFGCFATLHRRVNGTWRLR